VPDSLGVKCELRDVMHTLAVLEVNSDYSPMSALDPFPLQNDITPKILVFREVPSIINVNFNKTSVWYNNYHI
jgi:hypothetical protein